MTDARARILRMAPAALVLAAGMFSATAAAQAQPEGGRPLSAQLTGEAERPNPGDPDGTGTASFRVNPGQAQICYDVTVSNIAPATMAHIHKAPATDAGPPVITLKPPGADGKISDCATGDRDLIRDILQNPDAYYINVHNAEFPGGAVRGQLSK